MAAVDRSSPVPLWAQLLDDLRRRIDDREFVDAFPTDAELQAEYQLSRHTVREAVRRLQDEGIVDRQRGRGTFVTGPSVEQPSGALYSLFRLIEEQGYVQDSTVLDLGETTDAEVAGRLGLRRTAPLVRLERVRHVDGVPLAHDVVWVPAAIGRPLLDVDFGHTALYDELDSHGLERPTAGIEHIGAVLANATERAILQVGATQPLFAVERLGLVGDRPVEWRRTMIRADRYTIVTRWSPAQTTATGFESQDAGAPGGQARVGERGPRQAS